MRVEIPISKSCYARIATVCAIAGIAIPYSDENDDITAIREALQAAGERVWIGSSGTAARFATAYYASMERQTTIDGSEQMRKRPVSSILEAVMAMGAVVEGESLPVRINGKFWANREIEVDATQSSQTISAMMLAGMRSGLTIRTRGERNSWSYVELTASIMRRCGVEVEIDDEKVRVGKMGKIDPAGITVERDWSSASFWYGWCATRGEEITIGGLRLDSCQPDRAAVEIFGRLGVRSEETSDGIRLIFEDSAEKGAFETDCRRTPDLAMVLIPTLCRMGRPFRVTGLDTLDRKESARGTALCAELRKSGCRVEWDGTAMSWNGESCERQGTPETYGDHRMVIAHLIVGNKVELTPLGKSYPWLRDFFEKKFGQYRNY